MAKPCAWALVLRCHEGAESAIWASIASCVMRAAVLLLLLAGCSATPASPDAPTEALYQGGAAGGEEGDAVETEHVPMDPVAGSVTADGMVDRHCQVVSGGGSIMTTSSPWTFKVGSNATKLVLTADWTAHNPTIERLGLDLRHGEASMAVVEGTPGFSADVDVRGLEAGDRRIEVRIAPPACGSAPVAVQYYQGVQVQVQVTFS